MNAPVPQPGRMPMLLETRERLLAGATAVALIITALVLVVVPPDHQVVLPNCPNAAAGCIVSVDTDLTALSAALAAIGFVGALVAILGVRFTSIKAGGVEAHSAYTEQTAGLPQAAPQRTSLPPAAIASEGVTVPAAVPVTIEIEDGLGKQLGVVPVAVTRLTDPMPAIDPSFLRDYQSARRASQNSYFVTHILGPPTLPRQKYSVALKVTPHRDARPDEVSSAVFYLGRSWGNAVFECERGSDGRFGIVTEAYGPFLALCEVEFTDGSRILLDHYCDFDMGTLIPT